MTENLSSPPVVCFSFSIFLCSFVDPCFSICLFSFGQSVFNLGLLVTTMTSSSFPYASLHVYRHLTSDIMSNSLLAVVSLTDFSKTKFPTLSTYYIISSLFCDILNFPHLMCYQDENISCGFELGVFLIFTCSSIQQQKNSCM